jgi:hypothetical protein
VPRRRADREIRRPGGSCETGVRLLDHPRVEARRQSAGWPVMHSEARRYNAADMNRCLAARPAGFVRVFAIAYAL